MRHHLVVVRDRYLGLILAGKKTVECRLSSVRKPPFGVASPGDLLWLKPPSQPIRAVAVAGRCLFRELRIPSDLPRLAQEHADQILAEEGFFADAVPWARFASLIWIRTVVNIRALPVRKSDQRAWVTLDGPPDPGMRISERARRVLHRGELRNPTSAMARAEKTPARRSASED